jgi:colanic acid/amylovoran biosynthesis protein
LTNVLMASHHSNNRGDEAALRGLMTSLKEAIPDARFTVLASTPKDTAEVFRKEEMTVLGWLPPVFSFKLVLKWSSFRKLNIFLNIPVLIGQGIIGLFNLSQLLLWVVLRRYGMETALLINNETREILRKIAEADIVLFSPAGPYFGDLYLHQVPVQALQVLVAKILRKPVMICAPSMGPFHKTKWICKYTLNKVDVITLREEVSGDMLAQLKLSHPLIRVTADCGLLQSPASIEVVEKILPEEIGQERKHPLVGITVYPAVRKYIDYVRYKKIMAQIADYVISELNAKVLFVPQWYGKFSDSPLIEDIVGLMHFKDETYVIPEDSLADQMHGIFGELDLLIATRYHSAVLASTVAVPCVLIAYEHKAKGFMHMLGLEDFLLDIKELSLENLIRRVKKAWAMQDQIKSILPARIRKIEKRALFNVILAVELLEFYRKGCPSQSFKDYLKHGVMKNDLKC